MDEGTQNAYSIGRSWGELPDKEWCRQATQQRLASPGALDLLWGLLEPWAWRHFDQAGCEAWSQGSLLNLVLPQVCWWQLQACTDERKILGQGNQSRLLDQTQAETLSTTPKSKSQA